MKAENISVPDKQLLGKVEAFCNETGPYEWGAGCDARFTEAMNEVNAWHVARSPVYAKRFAQCGYKNGHTFNYENISDLPFIMAEFFKMHEVLSIPKEQVFLHLTSSGTTGQKSQVFLDEFSIKSAQRMVDHIFSHYGWNTPERESNYLLFTYESAPNLKLGTSYTDYFLCKYSSPREVFAALRRDGKGGHEFDAFGSIEILKKYAEQGLPVRIFGFPAFLFFTLERMRALGVKLSLHPDSLIFLGGGWKGNADKAISKNELYELAHELLGFPMERMRDGFGSVEHSIPYVECERHNFHVPKWSRVFARDVTNLKLLPYGQKGLLHFVSPYIVSVPAHSVLMGDMATVLEPGSCGCKLATPHFVVHGRAGTSKNRSCAVAASELLKGRSA